MEHYEIQVVGHLEQRRAAALGCERLRLLPDGRTVLTFAAVDQAAIYGLLGRLRDAGLELVAAGRIAGPASPDGGTPSRDGCASWPTNPNINLRRNSCMRPRRPRPETPPCS